MLVFEAKLEGEKQQYERLDEAIRTARFKSQKTRIIKSGSGRVPKLAIAAQILMTLVYLHHLPTFQILGVQFGIGE